MKKLLMAVTVAVFPVGAAIGFCVVELVWQPNLSTKAKLLAVLVIGGGIAGLWLGPLLIYSFMNNRRRLARGREALKAGDMNLAFEQVHPMTAWTTCSNLEVGNQVLDLLATMYQQLGTETKIDEVARLHRKYYEIYNDAKDHQGIVDDEEIGEELHEIFETCRRLAKQLPPPGASLGT